MAYRQDQLCVKIDSELPTHVYQNGRVLWEQAANKFLFIPDGAERPELTVQPTDEKFISITFSNNDTKLGITIEDGKPTRTGDWNKFKNGSELYNFAIDSYRQSGFKTVAEAKTGGVTLDGKNVLMNGVVVITAINEDVAKMVYKLILDSKNKR